MNYDLTYNIANRADRICSPAYKYVQKMLNK